MAGSLTIHGVEPGSPAAESGVTAGSTLISVNGRPVTDALDLRFAETAGHIKLVWRDNDGRERRAVITKPDDLSLGLEVDPLKMHACNNKCAFCFAHQNAKGMRRGLYFKDDDFRFSFLNGNFATLTNLRETDFARIVEQRLSPLYISVHATEWGLRNEILGNPRAPDVLAQIGRFAAARITMHTQVVLCPGINDGPHLERTLDDLQRFHPWVETVALVPVGLTQYREKLPVLRSPDRTYARELVGWAEPRGRQYLRTLGTRFAFPSDEFYLLAELPFPSGRSYEGYAQIGNGVGGSRKFLDDFRRQERTFPDSVSPARRAVVVTGALAAPILAGPIARLNRVGGVSVRLAPIPNTFFGGSVTCAGLLTGSDIVRALTTEAIAHHGDVLIPSVCLRHDDDVLLDDMQLTDIGIRLGRVVVRTESTARDLVRTVLHGDARRRKNRGSAEC